MTRDAEKIDYLKLRKDLIFSRQQMGGETIVVVKDQAKGTYFRLREAEWYVTEQFDGETSLETVRKRVEERFGATLPQETLRVFVLNLRKNGFFETGRQKERSSPSRRRQWIRGSLLYLRFHAFDPDRLFTRLAQKVWFFTRRISSSFPLLSSSWQWGLRSPTGAKSARMSIAFIGFRRSL
jgi:hypothetical protein